MDDKAERSKAVSSQERDLLLHKTIEERKGKQIMLIIMTCYRKPQPLLLFTAKIYTWSDYLSVF